ncbi:MAG: TIGR04282 family arsenosugar biosynthesis glycosyltransferase [Nitrospira sp.]|nr:glycosyltransferase [Candidatus Manganitrophaceae bacterium]HIL33932.1 glycosyltransferase [Candidatus Manganitrophaceae bacterium]
MKNLLIIFAKAPEPGQVKTRLLPFLSPEQAATLHEAFILDTLVNTERLPLQHALACTPSPEHPFFRQCGMEHTLLFVQQEGKHLGERMNHALEWGFSKGFEKVLLIGSDTPTLPKQFIREGLDRLDTHPWVIGPSLDGGYYLIGGTAPLPGLFNGVRWGTDEVLTKTLKMLEKQKTPCHLLPFWYDIDRPKDLVLLKSHITLSKAQGDFYPKLTWDKIEKLKQLCL